jgi:hypothetical protein
VPSPGSHVDAGRAQVNATGSANRNELSENGEFPINSIPGFSRRFIYTKRISTPVGPYRKLSRK